MNGVVTEWLNWVFKQLTKMWGVLYKVTVLFAVLTALYIVVLYVCANGRISNSRVKAIII